MRSLWAPKTIVFRSLWSWQRNNVKPLAVWGYNDDMSFYRHMKWQCLSFHILEHFKYIFPCLVKTFDKFDAGLGKKVKKKRVVWIWNQDMFGMQNIHTIMRSNGEQLRCQHCYIYLFYFILRRLYNWHKQHLFISTKTLKCQKYITLFYPFETGWIFHLSLLWEVLWRINYFQSMFTVHTNRIYWFICSLIDVSKDSLF